MNIGNNKPAQHKKEINSDKAEIEKITVSNVIEMIGGISNKMVHNHQHSGNAAEYLN